MTKKYVLVLLGIICGIINSFFYYRSAVEVVDYSGTCGEISGIVGSTVQYSGSLQQFDLENVVIMNKADELVLKDQIRLFVPLFPEVNIGDKVSVNACINKSEYVQYQSSLESRGVGYISMGREVVVVKDINRRLKYKLKTQIIKSTESNFSEPYASIILGMSWGIKRIKGLPWDDVVRNCGVSYLFSASGHQIFAMSAFISGLSHRIFKRLWFLIGIIFLLYIYGYISDIGIGYNRAFMMLLFLNLGQVFGRPLIKEIVILFVISLLLIGNPSIYQLQGFQLSILATVGIIVFSPIIKRKLIKLPKLVSIFLVNPIVVQMMILPMIVSAYGGFSPFAIVVSSILSIFVPVIVVGGVILPLVSGVNFLWEVGSLIYYPILVFVERLLTWISKIPLSFVDFNLGENFTKFYYLAIVLLYLCSKNE